jgi:predicted DNA-binding protein
MPNDDNMELVGVRLPPESVDRIKKLADADHRTVSNLLRMWVEERLEREGRK